MPVYSTDKGKHCRKCLAAPCQCHKQTTPSAGDGIVRISRQTKGRAGKPVSIVTGLPLAAPELKTLAKTLKAKCGVGGSVNGSEILIQGDKREQIRDHLESQGYKVKFSGG